MSFLPTIILIQVLAGCSVGLEPIVRDRHRQDTGSRDTAVESEQGCWTCANTGDESDGGPQVPQVGNLVISELMVVPYHASAAKGRWVEIYNDSPVTLIVSGLRLENQTGNVSELPASPEVSLKPHQYGVICASSDSTENGGIDCIADWSSGGFDMSFEQDSVTVSFNGTTIDQVSWSEYTFVAGKSIGVTDAGLTSLQNDNMGVWLPQECEMPSGDYGTPNCRNQSY